MFMVPHLKKLELESLWILKIEIEIYDLVFILFAFKYTHQLSFS